MEWKSYNDTRTIVSFLHANQIIIVLEIGKVYICLMLVTNSSQSIDFSVHVFIDEHQLNA